jgi:chorismate mutase / prephenate dehydratase
MDAPPLFQTELQQYRTAIDAIDAQLLALFKERIDVVARVGELKSRHNVQGSYIRPAREAMMVRDLLARAEDSAFPKAAIVAIWRIIIGSSTALESPLTTLTFDHDAEGVHVAAQYFGPQVENSSVSEDEFFAALENNPHAIAIVPYVLNAAWWQRMPDPMRVFACLPFVGNTPSHLALGHVTPEPTGDDVSLFYDYSSKMVFTRSGFHRPTNPLVGENENVLSIGSYASPCAV